MTINAAHVSSNTFTVSGDHEDDLEVRRKIALVQGVDGISYVKAVSGVYSVGPNTTLVTVSPSSVTSNLATILLGATSAKSTGSHDHTDEDNAGVISAAGMSVAEVARAQDLPGYAGHADYLLTINATPDHYVARELIDTPDQITIIIDATSITFELEQDIAVTSSPEFAGLTLTTFSGVLKAAAGILSDGAELKDLDDVADAVTDSAAAGDTYYYTAGGNVDRLAIGSNGQFKIVASGLPAWVNPSLKYLSDVADAVTDSSVQYDLLIKGASDWERLAKSGSDGYVLTTSSGVVSWQPIIVPYQGNWVISTSYTEGDWVSNDGDLYVCSTTHTSSASDEPGVGGSWTTYWDLLVQGGGSTVPAPGPSWTPPDLLYKDADEVTVLAGRYWKGGYRFRGQYQDVGNLGEYWDVASNFDADVDATYSAGSTSGMIGGAKVNDSWYSVFMMDSDELLILPYVRIDTIDYNVSYAGKTTINPAAHDDGTTAENGFLVADDAWNTYRLVKQEVDGTGGGVYTIEDTVNGTPDEIVIDGDQTGTLAATEWLQLVPPSANDCCYLGTIRIDGSGNLLEFIRKGWTCVWVAAISVNGTAHASTPGNDDLASGLPPSTSIAHLNAYIQGTASTDVYASFYSGLSGTDIVYQLYHRGASATRACTYKFDWRLWSPTLIRNCFTKAGPAAADSAIIQVNGFTE